LNLQVALELNKLRKTQIQFKMLTL